MDKTAGGPQPATVGEAVDGSLAGFIPGYTLERRLGSGGMGDVYLARQHSLNRAVAIKLLLPKFSKDEGFIKRFLAEAQASGKLIHTNIVGVLDAGEANDRHFYVMQYVEGEPLSELIKREGKVPQKRALDITKQVALGLQYAQKHGLIHRDIKPANIMLSSDGVARILDFGIVRDLTTNEVQLKSEQVLSSPAYASPEQCLAQQDLDHRSDMYSLGVTLFEMLTGRLPFVADVPSALFVQHATQVPPSPRDLNRSISPAANQLVLRLLRKKALGRFATYEKLLEMIDSIGDSPASEDDSFRIVDVQSARPKWLIPAVAAGAVLVMVLVLYLALSGGEEPQDPAPTAVHAPKAVDPAEKKFQAQLKEVQLLTRQAKGDPSQYPAALAKWKELELRYRGTPHHSLVAGQLLEFEDWIELDAKQKARRCLSDADRMISRGRLSEAILALRGFSSVYEGTEASAWIAKRKKGVEQELDQKFREGRDGVWQLAVSGDFEGARKKLEEIRGLVATQQGEAREYVDPRYRALLEMLSGRVEKENLLAKSGKPEKGSAETAKKADPVPAPKPAPPKPPPTAKKLPVPDAASCQKATKMVRELFEAEYGKTDSASRASLTRKLLQLARETKSAPADRYVLYQEARDLAAKGGDLWTAFRAIDEMCQEYEGDPFSLKSDALVTARQALSTTGQHANAVTLCLELADKAITAGRLDVAEKAAETADVVARGSKSIPLVSKAIAKKSEVAALKSGWEKVEKAKAALSSNPEDPQANLLVGRYQCFVAGRWAEGLPLLAKGSDEGLKALAARDLAGTAKASDQLALGDSWWDLAVKEGGVEGANMRRRAAFWYGQALPNLTGLLKMKAKKRADASRSEAPYQISSDAKIATNESEGKGAFSGLRPGGLPDGPSSLQIIWQALVVNKEKLKGKKIILVKGDMKGDECTIKDLTEKALVVSSKKGEGKTKSEELSTSVLVKLTQQGLPKASPEVRRALVLYLDYRGQRKQAERELNSARAAGIDVDDIEGRWKWESYAAVKNRALSRAGGGEEIEAAVAASLRWLARHQDLDGSWKVKDYVQQCSKGLQKASQPCTPNLGHTDFDAGVTGLALLAFLGSGHTPFSGEVHDGIRFADVVRKGLDWILKNQNPEGCIGSVVCAKYMYNHLICSQALLRAYLMTGASELKGPSQKAVDFTLNAQNPERVWRYSSKCNDDDTSVTGWAVAVLRLAEACRLRLLKDPRKRIRTWFTEVTDESGKVGYNSKGTGKVYVPGLNESFDHHETMSAIALLAKAFVDRRRTFVSRSSFLPLLLDDKPEWAVNSVDFYYWYYATEAVFNADGPTGSRWKSWNSALKNALLKFQHETSAGCKSGSWEPVGRWSGEGGRVYGTALNAITLEIYYRSELEK